MCTKTDDSAPANSAPLGDKVQVSTHPIVSHKLTILRSSTTKPSMFRTVLREVTHHLGYEATSTLKTTPIKVSVPGGDHHIEHMGSKISDRVALIPIMRSGLGMTDSMLELIPNAGVHHIGMYKKKGQMPVQYYNRLPRRCEADVAYVLDPVIATGTTIRSVVGILKKWGVPSIHIVSVCASREGLKSLTELHPDVQITVGAIDEALTEGGAMMPGLGDAGDRLYKTHVDDEEELLHPSKRTRVDSM